MAQEKERSDSYRVVTPANCAIGPGALVINNIGTLPLEWKRPLEIPRQYLERAVVRSAELTRVHERLQAGTSEAMWGAPGVGKTTLAAIYAERYQELYPGGILWLSMGPETRGAESVNPLLKNIAAYAYRADAQLQTHLAGVVFSPEVVRSLLEGHGALLIVADDVWDRTILEPLRRALPVNGHLLVTTRAARVASEIGHPVELDVLKPEDAMEYTSRPLSIGSDGQQRQLTSEQQQELIRAVGCHPLALAIALGDLAVRGDDSWSECIAQIGKMVAEGQGFGDLPLLDEADRESRVEAALRHSYVAMGPEFQRRFRALGCMAQEANFDTRAAAAIWGNDERRAQEYLDVLVARALLKRQAPGRWQQHSILRAYGLSLQTLGEKQELPMMHARHYLSVARACHEAKPRDYDRMEREFSQVAHALSLAKKGNHAWGSTLVQLCNDFLRIRGRLSLLRTWLQTAQTISAAHEDRAAVANTYQSLGDLESRLGHLDEARKHYDAALPLYEAKQSWLGKANTLRSLGDLESHLGHLDEARKHYDAALSLFEAEQDQLGRANTLKSLGDLESRLGHLDQTRKHYGAALPLFEAEQDRLGKANTLKSLGDLEKRLGHVDEARKHYDAALPLYEAEQARLGKANTLKSLGDLERRLGHLDEARKHYDAALPLFEAEQSRLGKANTLQSLGDLESRLGHLDEARKHYDTALPLFEAEQERLGKANTLQSLGDLESRLGHLDEARKHYDAALPLYGAEQDRLGRANTLQSLGDMERRLGHLDEARKHYDAALPLFEAEQDRLGRANTLRSLGDLERRLGHLDEARKHYDTALPLYEAERSRLGKANTLKSLGDLESILGHLDEARKHYDAALPLFEAEQDRLGKANTLRSLGDLESRLGHLDEARKHYDAALPLYEAEQNPIGPLNVNLSLARLERSLGNISGASAFYENFLSNARELPSFAEHPMIQEIRKEYEEMKRTAQQAD